MLNLKHIGSEKDPPKEQYLISVDQLIGKGSFGRVYLAYNQEDFKANNFSHPICAKEIPREIISDNLIKSLKNESSIQLSNKSHRVLQMYAMKQTKSNIYFFLEYCPEGDLRHFIQKNKLTEPQVIYLFREIALALSELKKQGIFHRDLKPENILIKEGGIKIADFGFSKIVLESTKNNTQVGTPLYMSPQALSSNCYDLEKNDIWAAGCLLYEMIFHTLPWNIPSNQQSVQTLYNIIMKQQIQFDKDIKISSELKELIYLMLEIDEEGRLDWDDILNKDIIRKSNYNVAKDQIKHAYQINQGNTPNVIQEQKNFKIKKVVSTVEREEEEEKEVQDTQKTQNNQRKVIDGYACEFEEYNENKNNSNSNHNNNSNSSNSNNNSNLQLNLNASDIWKIVLAIKETEDNLKKIFIKETKNSLIFQLCLLYEQQYLCLEIQSTQSLQQLPLQQQQQFQQQAMNLNNEISSGNKQKEIQFIKQKLSQAYKTQQNISAQTYQYVFSSAFQTFSQSQDITNILSDSSSPQYIDILISIARIKYVATREHIKQALNFQKLHNKQPAHLLSYIRKQ